MSREHHKITTTGVARTIFPVVAVFLFAHAAFSQDRCGTVEYTKKLYEQNRLRENKQQFEEWLKDRIEARRIRLDAQKREAVTYQLPVVVHVIHNGETVGTGSNISDEQIISQIHVLNEDFQRLNDDASNTPAEFLPVAGSLDLEFVLAKQTPEGLPTTGIVRVQGTKSQWSINDNYELKSISYWPAEDYLNIWVTTLGSSFVGFAQFPVSDLPGLENSSNNRLTDGIVIHYDAFGTIEEGPFDLDPQYNKGRTTTHEIGHFLGLHHIWGDDESDPDKCSGTDHVDDTPNQFLNTNGCPSDPRTSCDSNDMYMNYLDYTNDACMNLFTEGQIARITAVVENSPRRASLLTSPGLNNPEPVANNLGIKSILSPGATQCAITSAPAIEIQNYGINTVTSTRIQLSRDGSALETTDFIISLDPLEATTLTFSPQTFSAGTANFSFEILLTNGIADADPGDNLRSVAVYVPDFITAPFAEDFNAFPAGWSVNNPDQQHTWELANAPAILPANTALKLNFYDYEDGRGEIDILTSPTFDLAGVPAAYVSFDVAYARFQNSEDRLRVYALTECSADLLGETPVYEKSGNTLATVPATSVAFTPSDAGDWRTEIIDLSEFIGESSVQLAFVSVNDWGNNLYIDNIALITSADEDLALKEIVSPTPVRCDNQVVPQLRIQNKGIVAINSFTINMVVNAGSPTVISHNSILDPGAEAIIALDEISLEDGLNELSFSLTEPNGLVDIQPSDNSKTTKTIIDNSYRSIPLRENFDNGLPDGWLTLNPQSEESWRPVTTNYNQSVYVDASTNPIQGDEAWLVSPVLDFSAANSGSLFFDLSYAFNSPHQDRLRIMTSTDCGQTYDEVVFDDAGEDLSVISSSVPWKPESAEQWMRKFVVLNNLAGNAEARLALVMTNAGGNNLYVDNLEFFTDDDPNPKAIDDLFLIYGTGPSFPGSFYITFNLDEPQSVGYEVLDVTGRSIAAAEIAQVLNQTFLIDAGRVATGIYILRLRIGARYYASKVFMEAP